MGDSKLILAIGIMATLASTAGCAGKIRYPSYYVLNVLHLLLKVSGQNRSWERWPSGSLVRRHS